MTKSRRRAWFIIVATFLVLVVICSTIGRDFVIGGCWFLGVGDSTYYGWHTNLLRPGQRVVVAESFHGQPADQVLRRKGDGYDWLGVTPVGDIFVARGSQGSVKIEPAWDEDSCDPDRPIAVELSSGQVVALPRHILSR